MLSYQGQGPTPLTLFVCFFFSIPGKNNELEIVFESHRSSWLVLRTRGDWGRAGVGWRGCGEQSIHFSEPRCPLKLKARISLVCLMQ